MPVNTAMTKEEADECISIRMGFIGNDAYAYASALLMCAHTNPDGGPCYDICIETPEGIQAVYSFSSHMNSMLSTLRWLELWGTQIHRTLANSQPTGTWFAKVSMGTKIMETITEHLNTKEEMTKWILTTFTENMPRPRKWKWMSQWHAKWGPNVTLEAFLRRRGKTLEGTFVRWMARCTWEIPEHKYILPDSATWRILVTNHEDTPSGHEHTGRIKIRHNDSIVLFTNIEL